MVEEIWALEAAWYAHHRDGAPAKAYNSWEATFLTSQGCGENRIDMLFLIRM